MLSASLTLGADNEIYIDQSGDSANIDLEQLGGDGNIIGGLDSVAGQLTPLDLDGDNLLLDINQIGGSNSFLGDILADNFTGYFNFDGSSNAFEIQVDPDNTYGADGSDVNVLFKTYEWNYAGKNGIGADLQAVQVINLVEYSEGEDFDVVPDGYKSGNDLDSDEIPF